MTVTTEAKTKMCGRLPERVCTSAMAGDFLIQKQKQQGWLPTTISSLVHNQVKDGNGENENEKVVIIWEVLRHSLGD